ncbi:hypothetical protein [uncultured Mediterranean phage uvMED]|nr:hypothetical protein [uncultured Mediterranean phage uvMED]BAR22606.1 hypothetical protein [uncultured Mediterranean phage uvMED]
MKEKIQEILTSWVIDTVGAHEPYISADNVEEIAKEIEKELTKEK